MTVWMWLADAVVLVHFAFVVFAVAGGWLALVWPRLLYAHVPCALWAAGIEMVGGICPLTYLEHWLVMQGGGVVDGLSFVDRYIMPVLYPPGLTRTLQIALGVAVVLINGGAYFAVWRVHFRRPKQGGPR